MPKETQHTEWKANWRDEYLRWVCGFAYVECGSLLFGKDEEEKKQFLRKAVGL